MSSPLIESLLNIPEETQQMEFKRLAGENVCKKIVETIVAMTNTDGGTIVLGIDDPEKTTFKGLDRIFGIDEEKDLFDFIGREIQKIVPPLATIWPPEIIEVPEVQKRIAIIDIPKSTDSFRYYNNKVYIRQQKSIKELNPQEIINFAYAKGFKRSDTELVNIDFSLIETKYYVAWRDSRGLKVDSIKDCLEKTGLARKDDNGVLTPTRAAVLLFAEYPTNLMDTKSAVRVFQYTGTLEKIKETPNLISNPKTIHGPLIKMIQDSQEYVLTLLRAGISMPRSGFVTKYQIPERVIKEAITNAVIHRDYFIKRDIEIKIFEDRVEIQNPGLLPFNITASNIGRVRADGYRNDLIVKHLREFPEPPNLDQNEGVRAMRSEMKAQNFYPPIFFTYPHLKDSVDVILLNEIQATEWEKLNHYLEQNKYITNKQARDVTGVVQMDKMSKKLSRWV